MHAHVAERELRFAVAVDSALLSAMVITIGPPPLISGQAREHDEDPHESKQREERDTARTPVNRAEHVQAQADQTRGTEDTVDASVNFHGRPDLDTTSGVPSGSRGTSSPDELGDSHDVPI